MRSHAALSALLVLVLVLAACDCGGDRGGGGVVPRHDSGMFAGDAAQAEAGPRDAGAPDASPLDATDLDATQTDAEQSDAEQSDAEQIDADTPDAIALDADTPDADIPDADLADTGMPGVIDVTIFVDNTCVVTTTPATIGVTMGTAFTVNWINSSASASPVDIDKIDQFNQVPIVIGLEVGNSYHDTVREWCGAIFTGTFSFRITGCFDPYYLDVDCSI